MHLQDPSDVFMRMTADVEAAFMFFGSVEHLKVWLEGRLENIGVTGLECAPWMSLDAGWWQEAVRLLSYLRAGRKEPALQEVSACAFFDKDRLTRGIAWRLLMEAWSDGALATAVDGAVTAAFIQLATESAREDASRWSSAAFFQALKGTIAVFRGRAFCRGLETQNSQTHAWIVQHQSDSIPRRPWGLSSRATQDRLDALSAVWHDGPLAIENAVTIARMAFADPAAEVRIAAISAYASIYQSSSAPDAMRLLANIAWDDEHECVQRVVAYRAVLVVIGKLTAMSIEPFLSRKHRQLGGITDSTCQYRLNEVDWNLVDRCRHAS